MRSPTASLSSQTSRKFRTDLDVWVCILNSFFKPFNFFHASTYYLWNLFLNLRSQFIEHLTKTTIEMKVKELVEKLDLKVLAGEQGLEREIDGCYISDLLSDVMGNAMEGNIWITLQTHKNVMAVASLKELACIILVKDLVPNAETIEQSNDDDLPLLQTSLPTYEIAGLVYNLLHQ